MLLIFKCPIITGKLYYIRQKLFVNTLNLKTKGRLIRQQNMRKVRPLLSLSHQPLLLEIIESYQQGRSQKD